jgi:hypothetical protein
MKKNKTRIIAQKPNTISTSPSICNIFSCLEYLRAKLLKNFTEKVCKIAIANINEATN